MIFKTGYAFEIDVWNLGVIMFTLLTGYQPFNSSDPKEINYKIKVAEV